jgi:hypothetical protein
MKLLFLLGVLCTATGLASAGTANGWQSFGFDGNAFQKGIAGGAIQVKDGYLPISTPGEAPRADQLPSGTGALAVLCYSQSSGGKLSSQHPPMAPMAGIAITVHTKSLTIAGRTDANGYLILALPPGSYEVQLIGSTKKVTVEVAKTALVAMRGGKRMVD